MLTLTASIQTLSGQLTIYQAKLDKALTNDDDNDDADGGGESGRGKHHIAQDTYVHNC